MIRLKIRLFILGVFLIVGAILSFYKNRISPLEMELKTIVTSVSDNYYNHNVVLRSGRLQYMGTFANITIVAKNDAIAKNGLKSATEQIQRVQSVFDWRLNDSQLSKINSNAFENPVSVSDEMLGVLAYSQKISRKSDGAFDITVGAIIDLWKSAKENGKKPTPQQIAQAKEKCGYEKLILDEENRTVRFLANGIRLDLGAVAKGYAIDQAIEVIKSCGAAGAMVDIGGDVRCFGVPPADKKDWKIGLQDPRKASFLTREKILTTFDLGDKAIATSGDYRRYVIVDGEKQSHIIDLEKGAGSRGLSSVSVIAPTAICADAMATAVTVMGHEKGLKLIEATDNVECVLVTGEPDFAITKSSGLQ